jgi:phenylacetate-coenzyme A ligase PaaK-like adenylate-forming protein
MMKVIEGRVDDFVVLPNGKVLPPITWIILLMYYRIDQFKIIQESTDTLHVLIVPKADCTTETLASIRRDVERVTDNLVQVTLESVPAIDREASGKTRPIVSKVKWNGCCG